MTALNEGRGDFFAVLRSLALFVNALHQNDKQFVALNQNLAQFTTSFTNTDHELADAVQQFDKLLPTVRKFFARKPRRAGPRHRQPRRRDHRGRAARTLERAGDGTARLPDVRGELPSDLRPGERRAVGLPALTNFANPMEFICSAIQAGSRLGYQDSAELCAQYLAPILDAIKFNYLPFGLNLANTAALLPKMVAYSEERLRPPPGYKDTTVPGIFSPDTPFSHGNYEPGWIVAPGMQGSRCSPPRQTPVDSGLAGRTDGWRRLAPPPAGQTMPGPPDAYDETQSPAAAVVPATGAATASRTGRIPGPVPGGSPPAGPGQ